MEELQQQKYAELIVTMGANVQPGQEVWVIAELDQPEFVRMVAEAAYRAGASHVQVEWQDQAIDKLRFIHETTKRLGFVALWEKEKMQHRAEILPCMIYLESADPDGLDGIDHAKYSSAMQSRMKVFKPIRDRMENHYRWVIAAVPGIKWAKKVFPELPAETAVERLWQVILKASRADGASPEKAWQMHNEELHRRCQWLTRLQPKKLHIVSGNGTDITVGLMPHTCFLGGAETIIDDEVTYNANIPSEEVYITPMRGDAEGIAVSSRPFSYRGQLIERFTVRFENGKAVDIRGGTEKETEILREMISMDEGASYLGEVALVPYSSPIRQTEILFYNTLFDENAACHLAFGRGFDNSLVNYENMSPEEIHRAGVNDSILHEDFMIGTADTQIDAICDGLGIVPIFRQGEWVDMEENFS